MYFYILDDDHHVRRVDDPLVYAQWMESHLDRTIVAQQYVGPVFVSTVFIGLSTPSIITGQPRAVFETMTFVEVDHAHPWHQRQWRYDTWDEAAAGHRDIVNRITREIPLPAPVPGSILRLPN